MPSDGPRVGKHTADRQGAAEPRRPHPPSTHPFQAYQVFWAGLTAAKKAAKEHTANRILIADAARGQVSALDFEGHPTLLFESIHREEVSAETLAALQETVHGPAERVTMDVALERNPACGA